MSGIPSIKVNMDPIHVVSPATLERIFPDFWAGLLPGQRVLVVLGGGLKSPVRHSLRVALRDQPYSFVIDYVNQMMDERNCTVFFISEKTVLCGVDVDYVFWTTDGVFSFMSSVLNSIRG